jgi:hypothetical protein
LTKPNLILLNIPRVLLREQGGRRFRYVPSIAASLGLVGDQLQKNVTGRIFPSPSFLADQSTITAEFALENGSDKRSALEHHQGHHHHHRLRDHPADNHGHRRSLPCPGEVRRMKNSKAKG